MVCWDHVIPCCPVSQEAATVFEHEAIASEGQLDINGVWHALEKMGIFTSRSTVKSHMSEADSKVG